MRRRDVQMQQGAPTVKTMGYFRPAPPGRRKISVPEGLPKVALSFKAGIENLPAEA